MSEKQIETAACRRALNKFGIESIKLTPARSTGYPDRMFFIPGGRPLLIEFKAPGEELRTKQHYIHRKLIKLGYDVATCWSADEAETQISNAICDAALRARR